MTGTVTLGTGFGIASIQGLDSSTALGTYTLIDGTSTDFSLLGLQNWGLANAYYLGNGRAAYFKQGSLQVEVVKAVPEPSTWALLLGSAAAFLLRRNRAGKATPKKSTSG